MKFILMILIAALFLSANPAVMDQNLNVTATSPDDFDADGYDGAWATVAALDVEIFLPEGWTGEDISEDDACYRAAAADGSASLTILYPVDDPATGEVASANGKNARLQRGDDGSLTVTLALSGDRVAAFRFERTSEDALSEEMALSIAGSCVDVW